MTENRNKTVFNFLKKRMKVHSSLELEELIDDFLTQCAGEINTLQVWPINHGILCTELILTCNYLIALSSRQRENGRICSHIEMTRAEDLVLHTLHRVSQCICNPHFPSKARIPTRSNGDTVAKQMMQIISSLENPIIHFKGLAVMGHLLALSCLWCVCSKLIDAHVEEAFSCLTHLKQLSSQSVLKEKMLFYHGLLLCSPLSEGQDCDKIVPSVGDVVIIVSVAWDKPSNLSLEYQPWKWLYICLECKALMRENRYSKIMSKLNEVLETDLDPEIKARVLCLFADCYNKQDCHQLAIQTYREALQVDNGCICVMWYLSSIYQSLGQNDLELECLNLLVNMLSDAGADQRQLYTCNLDEIVWSIFSPMKSITLPMAMYTFAKRCFQLKRYKEAAEQYFNLILKLQSQTIFPQQFLAENFATVDIRELMVETAEALLIDRRLRDCLTISNHVCSCISVSDSLMLPNEQSKSWDPFDDNEDLPSSSSSPDALPCSISPDRLKQSSFAITKESVMLNLSMSEALFGRELKKLMDLEELSSQSRKRLRSNDTSRTGDSGTKSKMHLLKARALLCKSDALIMTEGFTDHSFACLSEALDVLLNQPCKPGENKLNNSTHSPCLKRQRISSDSVNNFSNQKQQRHENFPQDCHGSNSWMSLTLNTALRMGKASFERKRFSSVINSCLLALQLDTDNTAALFLKTMALSKHQATKMKSSTDWLQMRGITDLDDVKKLEANLREKEAFEKTQTEVEEGWWHVSEKDFIGLDIQCLQFLLETK